MIANLRRLPIEVHAITDAFYFALLVLLAAVADHGGHTLAAAYCAAIAAAGIGLYLLSAAPLGLYPMITFRVHAAAEFAAAPLLIMVAPMLFYAVPIVAWALPALGLFNLAVNLLTRYPAPGESPDTAPLDGAG